MDQDQERKLPENAKLLMAIQHTGKALLELPVSSPLWEFYGTYSGIARYRLTKEGSKQFATLAREFPEVVCEHLNRAQQALDEEIAAQREPLDATPVKIEIHDETWGIKTNMDGSIAEASNGSTLVPPGDRKLVATTMVCRVYTEDGPLGGVVSNMDIAPTAHFREVFAKAIDLAKAHRAFVDFDYAGCSHQAAWTSDVETLSALHARRLESRNLEDAEKPSRSPSPGV